MLPHTASVEISVPDYKEASCAMVPDCTVGKYASLGGNVFPYMVGLAALDPNCPEEKLAVSLESYEPFSVVNTDSSRSLDAQDALGTDVLVGAFNSVSIAEMSGQRDDELKDNVTSDDASETKGFDSICSYPQSRSTCMSRLNQNTRTKKAGRDFRKTTNKKALLELIFLKVTRRRRSCFSRRPRSFVWGSLGYIAQAFEQNTGLNVGQNKLKKSRKDRSGGEGVKRSKNRTGQISQRSRGITGASTGRIRLKIKLGKGVVQSCLTDVVPIIENDLDKCCGTRIGCPKLIEGAYEKLEKEALRGSGFCCAADNKCGIPFQEEVEGLVVKVDNRCLDPGTSPDSEVINVIPDGQISEKTPGDLQDVLISCQECVVSGDVTSSSPPQMSSKKGKEKDKLHKAGNCSVESRILFPEVINSDKVSDEHGQREKIGDGSGCSGASILATTGNESGNTSSSGNFSRKSLPQSGGTNFGVSCDTLKVESGTEVDLCSRLESPGLQISEPLLSHRHTRDQKLPKSSKSRGMSKSRSEVAVSASRRGNARRQKENQSKSVSKCKVMEKGDSFQAVCKVESHLETGNHASDDLGETKHGKKSSTGDLYNLDVMPSGMAEQNVTPRTAVNGGVYKLRLRTILKKLIADVEVAYFWKGLVEDGNVLTALAILINNSLFIWQHVC
ncbi:unnamed protein product [Ilex paraguariensis]|uniref:Uncharacterized protein n=1 Tax=Ilex paraguariensis TaxID=185542 RepID=A0ABC8S4D2_9AQUA